MRPFLARNACGSLAHASFNQEICGFLERFSELASTRRERAASHPLFGSLATGLFMETREALGRVQMRG